LTALIPDHEGTTIATVNLSSGQTVKRQKTDPFGVGRSSDDTWISHRGYIGGTDDNTTGLTHSAPANTTRKRADSSPPTPSSTSRTRCR
jgi:hypothetical protein